MSGGGPSLAAILTVARKAYNRDTKARAKAYADEIIKSAGSAFVDQLSKELAIICEKRKKMFAFRDAQRRKNLPFWRRS